MGWAVGRVELGEPVDQLGYGCVQTNSTDSIDRRYVQLTRHLQDLIDRFRPAELAIESVFFSKNTRTALRVSEARGVIIGRCLDNRLAMFEYTPTQIKQAVAGHGRADKQAVTKMVCTLLGLATPPQSDDAVDALAVLLTHSTARTMVLV